MIPYGAQYKPVETENGPRLQKQLVRHTEPEYSLVGALPEKPKPTAKQQAAVAVDCKTARYPEHAGPAGPEPCGAG